MTHAQLLLELLSDGKPHSHHETYRLGIMAHSRAADLRKQGHDVRVWREDGSYWYQLLLPQTKAASATGEGIDGGPSALVSGSRSEPQSALAPSSWAPSSPTSAGVTESTQHGTPAGSQLALELPARLKEVA